MNKLLIKFVIGLMYNLGEKYGKLDCKSIKRK